jgi:hypothetical protein
LPQFAAMADEPTTSGWLPPRAPGAQPAPRFEPAPPEPERVDPPPAAAAAPPAPAADRPTFVRTGGGETNGLALTALILGIIGVSLLVLSLGVLFIVTLPCSIGAWICAAQARARIAVGESSTGQGQAQAGFILGILGVVLGVMAMIGWIAALASGLDLDELRQELERQSNPDAVQAVLSLLRR